MNFKRKKKSSHKASDQSPDRSNSIVALGLVLSLSSMFLLMYVIKNNILVN